MSTLKTGATLGPYEILGEIGAGGMGEVYRARDPRLDREVAIKVILHKRASSEEALARFERESKAVAALSHPNILTIHDYGAEDGVSYSVSELLEGRSLRDRMISSAVPWQESLEVGLAVAEGLSAAHAKGIIHRDIKPDNIFITSAGHVKILDFGLVRLESNSPISGNGSGGGASEPANTPAETIPGTLIGTIHYMSPEQARGRPADSRSDIFSLGAVLYEMLCGERPFGRPTAAETMVAIMNEDPIPIVRPGLDISTEFADLINRCLQKEPANRHHSAADLAFGLRAVQSSSEVARPRQGSGFARAGDAPVETPPTNGHSRRNSSGSVVDETVVSPPPVPPASGHAPPSNPTDVEVPNSPPKIPQSWEADSDSHDFDNERPESVTEEVARQAKLARERMQSLEEEEQLRKEQEQRQRRRTGQRAPGKDSETEERRRVGSRFNPEAFLQRDDLPEPFASMPMRTRRRLFWIAVIAILALVFNGGLRLPLSSLGKGGVSVTFILAAIAIGLYMTRKDPHEPVSKTERENVSNKKILPASLMCGFFGVLGVHRFYVGKVGTGILLLCTGGGLGIWWIVDFFLIVSGNFRDNCDQSIVEWT